MNRIVWKFGLIAGAIFAVSMCITIPFGDRIGVGHSVVLGYAIMVVAFLMVCFGMRAYRDEVLGGSIRYGQAFMVGLLITLIACVFYVATWEVLSHTVATDFADKYAAGVVEQARASGASAAELEAKTKEMARFKVMYANPLYNVGMTFMECFPVGLLFTLVCAWFVSRRRSEAPIDGGLAPGRTA